ncbi:hypothetical protein [Nostoc sp. UHCC 0251]|uniref:hypothetical protein n=1 Tax=Nostoc sp. UHCC 0251 TaxID=3110240 RepID=UPI002B1ED3BB|nr:hypothetical protein [Nostoc sp. UHCC 0251]MEA5625301.1 hypothetical protein [Nostoc sp. UHCC 0251]
MSIKLANLFRFFTGEPKIVSCDYSCDIQPDGTVIRSVTYYYEKSDEVLYHK